MIHCMDVALVCAWWWSEAGGQGTPGPQQQQQQQQKREPRGCRCTWSPKPLTFGSLARANFAILVGLYFLFKCSGLVKPRRAAAVQWYVRRAIKPLAMTGSLY